MTLTSFLADLERNHFYGSVEIKFENGNVILIRKTENLKLTQPDYGNARGTANDYKPTR
jgi:hypothetical protein